MNIQRNVFFWLFYFSYEVPSVDVLFPCSCSIMFAEECRFVTLGHNQKVLCLQGSALITRKQQVVGWTDCVTHIFIYSNQTSVEWHVSHHPQLSSSIFYF